MADLIVQAPSVEVPVGISAVVPWVRRVPSVEAAVAVSGSLPLRIQAAAVEVGVQIGSWPITPPAGWVPTGTSDYPPIPLAVTIGGTDVSHLLEGPSSPTWSSGVSQTGSATIVIVDLDDELPWPIVPTDGDKTMCHVTIGDLWEGVVVGWSRQYLFPGWRYTFRCEGYERILGIDPQESYSAGASYTVVTAPNGYRYMRAAEESDLAPTSTWPWVGKRHNRVGTAWRQGLSETAWVWSGGSGGHPDAVPTYWNGTTTPGAGRVSAFSIGFAAGDMWPESVSEDADGSAMREGVGVETRLPNAHWYVTNGGVTGAGHDVIQVNTSIPAMAYLAGLIHMSTRGDYERRWSIRIPAGVLPRHVYPEPGKVVLLNLDPYTTGRYFLITRVAGTLVARGEGEGGVEWQIDLGNGSRPSFVVNEYDATDVYLPAPEVSGLECSEVQDMGADTVQYIYAWLLDAENNRVRLGEGTVEWSVWVNSVDRGVGSEALGWWLESRRTDVVYTDDQPLGFAYCALHCGSEAATDEAVVLTARLIPTT